MGFALVYLGEHYVIDVAVGMAVAAYAWFAAGVWRARAAQAIARAGREVGSSREILPQPTTQGVGG
jgi:membrane-associated phospholipid phosphatase